MLPEDSTSLVIEPKVNVKNLCADSLSAFAFNQEIFLPRESSRFHINTGGRCLRLFYYTTSCVAQSSMLKILDYPRGEHLSRRRASGFLIRESRILKKCAFRGESFCSRSLSLGESRLRVGRRPCGRELVKIRTCHPHKIAGAPFFLGWV